MLLVSFVALSVQWSVIVVPLTVVLNPVGAAGRVTTGTLVVAAIAAESVSPPALLAPIL